MAWFINGNLLRPQNGKKKKNSFIRVGTPQSNFILKFTSKYFHIACTSSERDPWRDLPAGSICKGTVKGVEGCVFQSSPCERYLPQTHSTKVLTSNTAKRNPHLYIAMLQMQLVEMRSHWGRSYRT